MNKREFLKMIGVGAVAGTASTMLLRPSAKSEGGNKKEDNLHLATKTGVLRCAYASYDPMVRTDVVTGKKSGIFYDIVNQIGQRTGLKIDWVEEVGYGEINQGFVTGRYDVFAGGLWPSGNRARNTIFSEPLFYDPVSVFVRKADTRFDGNVKKLNSPHYTVAMTDGDATQTMAGILLPLAKPLYATGMQSIATEMQDVATGKADAMFRDLITVARYHENNPETFKNISPDKPVFMYPLTVGFNEGEYGLKTLFDTVIYEMKDDGTIAEIIRKYMKSNSHLFSYEHVEYRQF